MRGLSVSASRRGTTGSVVEVVDDGIGGAAESPGSGLQGLRDRVEAVGGRFALDSTRGGTRITALVPTATPASVSAPAP